MSNSGTPLTSFPDSPTTSRRAVSLLTEATIAAYLDRISAPRPAKPDLASLRAIQAAHLYAVPFENLGYHLAEEIHMDERVVDKIVNERRGGGCYEVNPALSFLLEGLGYDVSLLPGRVWIKGELTSWSSRTSRVGSS
ncbi:arylamine N-acetyltransferase family protein [Streptomyces spectabilis]|uniref:arylamine N-acetyltransferase family protein n=1 Tax=Streptomyces spectabilis TaxID=68270 RepID=UPI0033C51BB7